MTTAIPTTPTVALPTTYSAATASPTTAGQPGGATGALGALTSNYNSFLKLLMTQLQNQDPTAPMDTNQFTTELVQFSSVEQQISTNSTLNQLLQATQGNNLLQSSSLIGKSVQISGDQLSLQNGQASIEVTGQSGQPVNVGVYSNAGVLIENATFTPTASAPHWTWDGKSNAGGQQPDGAYTVVVKDQAGKAVAFSTGGTVTGVTRAGTATKVQLGSVSTDLNSVQSLGQ